METPSETSSKAASGSNSRNALYLKIRDAIVSGELEPGKQLSESALAAWGGVSRTPVREALGKLERDSLVTWNENGLVVRVLEPEEVLDIYEVRAYLEAAAARTAADRRTERDLVMLRATFAAGDEVNATEISEVVRYSRRFMGQISRMARNAALVDALDRVKLQLSRIVEQSPTQAYPGRWEKTRIFQRELLELIAKRDVEAAYDITREHFFAARDIRLLMFSEEMDLGSDF